MEKQEAKLLLQKIKAAQKMLADIQVDLEKLLDVDEEVESIIEEKFLGDDGKEYECKTPYVKSKEWYCCSKPLIREGNVFHCSVCGSKYRA